MSSRGNRDLVMMMWLDISTNAGSNPPGTKAKNGIVETGRGRWWTNVPKLSTIIGPRLVKQEVVYVDAHHLCRCETGSKIRLVPGPGSCRPSRVIVVFLVAQGASPPRGPPVSPSDSEVRALVLS